MSYVGETNELAQEVQEVDIDLLDILNKFIGVMEKEIYYEVQLQKLVSRENLALKRGSSPHTPPIAEIICVKNVGAIVVYGFLLK